MIIKDKVILIVEDSDEDFYSTKRAFNKAGLANNIFRCCDGEEALDYLFHREKFADSKLFPRPNIILLDLNLPKMDGREVLTIIKQAHELKAIPIIVLTTSSDDRDIEKCYEYGANSYVQKPVDIDGFMKAIARLKQYWLEIAILPKQEKSP